jgi:hypothetical protein
MKNISKNISIGVIVSKIIIYLKMISVLCYKNISYIKIVLYNQSLKLKNGQNKYNIFILVGKNYL